MIAMMGETRPAKDDIDFVKAPPLSRAMLEGSFWRITAGDGRIVSPFLVLAPDGLVGNGQSPSIDIWQIVNGQLCFAAENGQPSILFEIAKLDDGKVFALAGYGYVDGARSVYVLEAIDHPDHPWYGTPPETDRRAHFLKQPADNARRPNLVVIPAGPTSLHPYWLEGDTNRTWDLCIGYYGAETPDPDMPCEYLAHIPRTKKFRLLYDLLHKDSPLWNYEAIWLPDDDILTSTSGINVMFQIFRKFGLDLAQPSLLHGPQSYPNHPITVQRQHSDVRYEPFVEIMCPIFSRRALKICVGSMRDIESGYGLDHLWPAFLGHPRGRIGIIDLIAMAHTRPIGATYDVRKAIDEQAVVHQAYNYTIRRMAGVW